MKLRITLGFLILPLSLNSCAKDKGIQQDDNPGPRIDTHIHLYDTRREGSSVFLNPEVHEKIYFPHFGQQFADTANPAGVSYAVVVEASKRRIDNYWLMNLVDTSDNIAAFIANLDPRDPYFKTDIDSLSKSEKFRGIRIRPESPIDLKEKDIIEALGELNTKGLVLELGGAGVQPDAITGIASLYPDITIIMNHFAGGRISNGSVSPDDWEQRISIMASQPNVYCKISALYGLSGLNPAPVDLEYYLPLIEPVVEAFGVARVMYGSNWTLSDMRGRYFNLIRMLDEYCDQKEELTKEMFYFENAVEAYGLEREFFL